MPPSEPLSPPHVPTPASRDDFARDVWCLLGIPVDHMGPEVWTIEAQDCAQLGLPVPDDAIARAGMLIHRAANRRERLSFVTPNVNWLVTALKNPDMRRMIIDADLSLIDGAPLVKMAGWLGLPMGERIAGSDLFEHLRTHRTDTPPLKIFFFGGRENAAQTAHKTLNTNVAAGTVTSMQSTGWLNPGFGDIEAMSTQTIIDEINAAAPDFLIVALGAAKGQAWIDHNLSRLNAPAIAHLGAVVDFTAGTVKRCPPWMAKAGLEWVWRIIADNALWKRYAKDAVSLAGLMTTALLPQMLSRRKPGLEATDARLSEREGKITIFLTGSFAYGAALDPVRTTFRTASAGGQNVILDFQNTESIDHAFLGLVLMLEKHLTRAGKTITLRHIQGNQLKLFRYNKMDYAIER